MNRPLSQRWRFLGAAGVVALAGLRAGAAESVEVKEVRDARGTVIALVNPAAQRGPDVTVAGGAAVARSRLYCSPVAVADPAVSSRAFLTGKAQAFGISDPEHDLAEGSVRGDDLGMTHLSYRQMHRGVPVYGAALVSHVNHRGEVVSVNGRTLAGLALDTTPAMPPSEAIRLARAATGREAEFSASRIPALQLLNKAFLGLGSSGEDTATRLVWAVALAGSGGAEPTYFINAKDGTVAHYDSGESHFSRQIYDCTPISPFPPGCYIDSLRSFGSGLNYYLGRSEGMPVRGPMPGAAGPPYAGSLDVDNAYQHYLPSIHQYFMDRFGRDGANNLGGTGNGTSVPFGISRMFVHGNGEPTNGAAYCNPKYAWAGSTSVVFCADTLKPAAYDLLGHEYGHLVARYRSFNGDGSPNSLSNFGPAGALNENVADIFGEMFEHYMTGSNDWQLFLNSDIGVLRSLSEPVNSMDFYVSFPSPDRFYSPNFYCGTADSGGIHQNSTVPGKAAWLAAVGGTFNGCTIAPIGLAKVEQIWYRALINYHAPSETFNGAYSNFIQACRDLYGEGDCAELAKALQAVEMDQPGACSGVPARPATCAPRPQLTTERTPAGIRWSWGAEAAGWTLQCSDDLATFTNIETITGSGAHEEPPPGAARRFCRLGFLP